jgi:hypothetical protein
MEICRVGLGPSNLHERCRQAGIVGEPSTLLWLVGLLAETPAGAPAPPPGHLPRPLTQVHVRGAAALLLASCLQVPRPSRSPS